MAKIYGTEDIYLDSSVIMHKHIKLNKILDEEIKIINVSNLPVSSTILEKTLLTTTIEDEGIYLFMINIPINFYGQIGRELYAYLKVNNQIVSVAGGVINESAFTLYLPLSTIANVAKKSNLKVTIKSGTAQDYACTDFQVKYLKLK
jgi:hypothetical protein